MSPKTTPRAASDRPNAYRFDRGAGANSRRPPTEWRGEHLHRHGWFLQGGSVDAPGNEGLRRLHKRHHRNGLLGPPEREEPRLALPLPRSGNAEDARESYIDDDRYARPVARPPRNPRPRLGTRLPAIRKAPARGDPGKRGAQARRRHHGRQPAVRRIARPQPHGRPSLRPREARGAAELVPRARHQNPHGLRLLDGEPAPPPRGGPAPHADVRG